MKTPIHIDRLTSNATRNHYPHLSHEDRKVVAAGTTLLIVLTILAICTYWYTK